MLANQPCELTTVADAFDPAQLQVGIRQAGIDRELPANLLTGGSIAALVRFQNRDLVDARNQLGQLAAALTDQLNRQQSLGLDLNGQRRRRLAADRRRRRCSPATVNTGGGDGRARPWPIRSQAAGQRLRTDARQRRQLLRLRRLSDNHLFGPPELPR